jgi:hypothetical protein
MKERRMLRVSGAVLMVCLFAACGGDKKTAGAKGKGDAATATTVTTGQNGSSPVTAGGNTTTTGSTGSGGSPTAGGSPGSPGDGGSTTTTLPPLPVESSVSARCVRPGTVEVMTVKSKPDAFFGYDTVYSDGGNGMSGGYGGTGSGRTDEKGVMKQSWTVAPNAPAGPVRTILRGVLRGYALSQTEIHYKVSDATGKCA